MAITEVMNMKASNKAKIDIHLEHSINYILQSKKLGDVNLVGGINCLPDLAYEQMKATKQMFGKIGGRQGYHFVISLKPGEGTAEIIYDIVMRFAEEAFAGEYEVVVAVHTDKEHLHAHVIINSINMVTGYKFQYREGDWKYKFQPITNRLCEEYGLHITSAEYSKEPKNMARPQWEREKIFSKWIEQDATFCAINAENMEHFIYLLKKAGFEVKQGEHIAVKVPGMKRFKRLDTISQNLSRENLEMLFKSGESSIALPAVRALSLPVVRKATLTPYQKKCYARMYRLRLAEKNQFSYKSANLYEQIRKMHELQEEYLVVVNYDVKSFVDLVHLKLRLQRVDEELCKTQKELYRERALQKRACKTEEDFMVFGSSESEYRNRLEQIKFQKKDNHKKLSAVERCLERDGSMADIELELQIPVGDIEALEVEMRGNSYHDEEKLEKNMEENIVISEAKSQLPADRETYLRMSVAEKVFCYPFDSLGMQDAFEMVREYFESAGIDTSFSSVYEEAKLLMDYYEEQTKEVILNKKVEQIIQRIEAWDINIKRLASYPSDVLAEIFDFKDVDYAMGIRVFSGVLERMQVSMEQEERYELFDRIYEEGLRVYLRDKQHTFKSENKLKR